MQSWSSYTISSDASIAYSLIPMHHNRIARGICSSRVKATDEVPQEEPAQEVQAEEDAIDEL
jgi:hypothetical protein